MNGGNISDGPNEGSGNDTELKTKSAPDEVNERLPSKNSTKKRLEKLQFEYDELQLRWLQDTKGLEHQMKCVKEAAERAMEGMRKQYESNVMELARARLKFDKYLEKNQSLEDRVEVLTKALEEVED